VELRRATWNVCNSSSGMIDGWSWGNRSPAIGIDHGLHHSMVRGLHGTINSNNPPLLFVLSCASFRTFWIGAGAAEWPSGTTPAMRRRVYRARRRELSVNWLGGSRTVDPYGNGLDYIGVTFHDELIWRVGA
jgi:hypothetical protein